MYTRIISRLDIKGPNLVKGIHLEGLRILGSPDYFARFYYENGADEILFVDAVASLYGRNSLTDIIRKTVENTFVPLTVAGGLRSIDDIRRVLLSGADKVALNTAAISRPEFISEAATKFGSSTIAVAIEAKRNKDGYWTAYTDNGRNNSQKEVVEWAVKATELGAGEILVTSIDREGTGKGFDIELTRQVTEAVNVPVVTSGGAGSIDHVLDVVKQTDVQAVSLASMLHYPVVRRLKEEGHDFGSGGEFRVVQDHISGKKFKDVSLLEIKSAFLEHHLPCRPALQHRGNH